MTEPETTTLVRSGVFGRVRNPIYTAMFTFDIGIALLTPNLVGFARFALLVATIELQVRRVEERYLLRVRGDAYRDSRRTSWVIARPSPVSSSAAD